MSFKKVIYCVANHMTYSNIVIRQFELNVYLGWTEAERLQPQCISLDIFIRFPSEPLACQTDELNDTFCYDTLTKTIKNHLQDQSFRLIESFAYTIYQLIKKSVLNECLITVGITKQPPIQELKGGVTFLYGDEKQSWSF